MRRTVARTTTALAFSSVMFAVTGEAAKTDFGLAANDTALWAFQERTQDGGTLRSLHFTYRPLDATGSFRRLAGLTGISGTMACAAVRGTDLHVFYKDGTHRRYLIARREPGPFDFLERKLPNSWAPRVLAADAVDGRLYTVIPGFVADELPDDATPGAEGSDVAEVEADADAAPVGPAGAQAGRTTLVYLDEGRWRRAADVPATLDDRRPYYLAAADGTCHLWYAPETAPGELRYRWFDGKAWGPPGTIERVRPRQVLTVSCVDGHPALLAWQDGARKSRRISVWEQTSAGWQSVADLEDLDTVLLRTGGPVAAAFGGTRVALAAVDDHGELRVGLWSRQGGPPVEAPAVVTTLRPVPKPWMDRRTQMFITYLVLSAILVAVFLGRRDQLVRPANLSAGEALAGFARRGGALALDLMFTAPMTYWVMSPLIGREGFAAELQVQIDAGTMNMPGSELFWRWLGAAAMFSAYGTLFELLMAATPGKRLAGCRVVRQQGGRCGAGAILVRNALRMIELFPMAQFSPMVILVLLTRNRQRLGDLAAGTVVVERDTPTVIDTIELSALEPSDDRTNEDEQLSPPDNDDR